MQDFTIYNIKTGEIIRTGSCPEKDFHFQAFGFGESIIKGNYEQDKYYFQTLQPILKEKMDVVVQNLASTYTKYVRKIFNLPIGGMLSITGNEVEIIKKELILEIDKGHTTMLKVSKFPYLDFETILQEREETIKINKPVTITFN